MKQCSKCGETKSLSEFYKRTNRKDYFSYCKKCHLSYTKTHRENNPELRKEWLKNKKDYIREYGLKRRYKLSLSEWQEMYNRQNGKCASCGRVTKLEVDHHHETGKVRGLLCQACNTSYGKLKEDVNIIQGLLQYAMKWQNV